MKVTRDGDTFTIGGKDWSGTYPMAELPQQLQFYRGLRDDFPKAAGRYDEVIAGLEALAASVATGA